jgi:hypothetical protein
VTSQQYASFLTGTDRPTTFSPRWSMAGFLAQSLGGNGSLLSPVTGRHPTQCLVGQSHDSSIVLRFEMISRARSWFIFSNTGCDANRATTLPGISYCTSSVTCAFAPLGSIL